MRGVWAMTSAAEHVADLLRVIPFEYTWGGGGVERSPIKTTWGEGVKIKKIIGRGVCQILKNMGGGGVTWHVVQHDQKHIGYGVLKK